MNLHEVEYNKYTTVWKDIPDYRDASPGLENVQRFIDVLHPRRNSTILDIGCGEGVAGLAFAERGFEARYLDITDAGLKDGVPRGYFFQTALWDNWPSQFKHGFDYGFCCDVMEHIPTEFTMLVADRILSSCRTTWFQIAFLPDKHGAAIGQPLHLTVKPFKWWLDHLELIGNVTDARDICGRGIFVVGR